MGKIQYCRKCGARLAKGLPFCGNCGALVSGTPDISPEDYIDGNTENDTDPGREEETLLKEREGGDGEDTIAPGGGGSGGGNRDRIVLIVVGIILAVLVVILVWLILGMRIWDSVATDSVEVVTEDGEAEGENGIGGESESAGTSSTEDTEQDSGTEDSRNTRDDETGSAEDTDTNLSGQKTEQEAELGKGTETEEEQKRTEQRGYILPDSAARLYSRSEIEALGDTELLYALNEIYARHGRIFKDEQIRQYFESQSWYHGTVSGEDFDSTQDQVFSTYEKQNRDLIVDVMEERGLR